MLDKIGLYKPIVWEYSRLNLEHTIVSKRTRKAIVNEGTCPALRTLRRTAKLTYWRVCAIGLWQLDPRMPTLMALRRGFTRQRSRSGARHRVIYYVVCVVCVVCVVYFIPFSLSSRATA